MIIFKTETTVFMQKGRLSSKVYSALLDVQNSKFGRVTLHARQQTMVGQQKVQPEVVPGPAHGEPEVRTDPELEAPDEENSEGGVLVQGTVIPIIEVNFT
jgi:hypothetical protein